MEETLKPKKRTYVFITLAVLVVLIAFAAFFFFFTAQKHTGRFPEQTYINGVDVSNQTAKRAREMIADKAEEYELTIVCRGGDEYSISGDQIELTYQDDGQIAELLESYSPYRWYQNDKRVDELTVNTMMSFNQEKAREVIQALPCFKEYTAAENATVVLENNRYVIQQEVEGNQLMQDDAVEVILNALSGMLDSVTLDDSLYVEPEIRSDDESLLKLKDQLNLFLNVHITYDFGDDRIVTIDASNIQEMVKTAEDGTVALDRDLVFQFVRNNMAYKYDTFGLKRRFITHNGIDIPLSGGDYGWCLDRDKTTDQLLNAIQEGYSGELEPIWKYKAKNLGTDDIGGTYVEVSISDQMMWCYKNGLLVVETPIVTGNISKGNGTPYGSVWAVDGMKRDATLGTIDTMGYSSPVSFWMPFTGNVGIHDADGWRSEYGGDIYLSRGSHGCVNTPKDACETIFNSIEVGTAVVVYDLNDVDADGVPDTEEQPAEKNYEITSDEDWDWDD